MEGDSANSNEDKLKVAKILVDNGCTVEDIQRIIPQVEKDYQPTNDQIGKVLAVISSKYTYVNDYIGNNLLSTVKKEDLGEIKDKRRWKKDGAGLKQYIYENELVETLLEEIGCEHIVYHSGKGYWSCTNPDGDNPSAVNVKNNKYLGVTNYTREKEFDSNADIISLVKYAKSFNYTEAYDYIRDVLGISNSQLPVSKTTRETTKDSSIVSNEPKKVEKQSILNESVLDKFIQILPIQWYYEGISRQSAEKFGICYTNKNCSGIIIPIRDYSTGKLIALSERSTLDDFTRKEFGIPKYKCTSNYKKHLNVYGLFENKADILSRGYVVIYESEKSVLKRDSMNDPTGVAIQGHYLSDTQADIISELEVDIVVSMDKDVSIEEILFMCEKLYTKRNSSDIRIYYTVDNHNLMGEKDSIADLSAKDYDLIFSEKVMYELQR